MRKFIERVLSILFSPKETLNKMKFEEISMADFIKEYVAILAAIPAVALFIGLALIGDEVNDRQNFIDTLFFSTLYYIFSLIGIFLYGKIINALAPMFNSKKNYLISFKLGAYAWTPAFVAGIFFFYPKLQVLGQFGALWGIYILYIGLPILMESPDEKVPAFTAVSVIAGLIEMVMIYFVAWAIAF